MIRISLVLPLLSVASPAGAQAPVAPDASIEDAARAVGAAAQEDETPQSARATSRPQIRHHASPIPPTIIDLSCPLDSGFTRMIDLSTGGIADWQVLGAGLDPSPRAYAVAAQALPVAWNIPLGQAKWVQALPASPGKLSHSQYVFKTLIGAKEVPLDGG